MRDVLLMVGVFAFSFIVGYILILRIPPRLHTPLMSMTNAVSAVTILGALMLFAVEMTTMERTIGLAAVALASFNLVGGFAVTDRMLKFFRKKRAHD
ncbi:MAG: NAD(P) transhydrogenase subunit alpha [Pirellulales bacterium]|nr:NAD(P) transhydrogenase subunit alpha [Pirellulales bacterium]